MKPSRIIVALLVLWMLAPLTIGAGPRPRTNPHLEKAKSLYINLHYGQVVKRLERALKVKGNTQDQLCEIYALMGTVLVVLENQPAAREAFRQLLKIDPGYTPGPDVSPKIADFISRVKGELAPPMKFKGKPKFRTRPGEYPQVMVLVDDQGRQISRVDLWCQDPHGKFRRKAMRPDKQDRFLGYFPVKAEQHPQGYRINYFVEALGADEKMLSSLGSRDKPLVFTVLPLSQPARKKEDPPAVAEASPWYKQWWIWAVAGVAVVGLSVGIGVAASGGEDVPLGTLGEITLD